MYRYVLGHREHDVEIAARLGEGQMLKINESKYGFWN